MSEELVNITINNIELKVPKGELIVESAKRLGIDIPVFCHHPRLKPVGMCRMCLVEVGTQSPDGSVRKMPKPQASCTLPASEGLVIETDTEQITKDRKGIVEFLLVNHPLDCPICDRGGECPLQNNTLFYGQGASRMIEPKRLSVKAYPLSEYVVLDRERCIHCARCTRFTEEISGDSQLGFLFRGAEMKLSTFQDTQFSSKFSGNTIEICPVGALTNRKYRFRARPWDLQTVKTICSRCSNGCNVHFDSRWDKLVRLNGRRNDAVNEEWTCDKGKFGNYYVNDEKRLTKPMIRQNGSLKESTWSEAADRILSEFSRYEGRMIAGLGGERTTNEDNWMFRKLLCEGFGTNNLDHRMYRNMTPAWELMRKLKPISIEELEKSQTILVIGSDLVEEQPIVFLRARKAWYKRDAHVISAHHQPNDVDNFARLKFHYPKGSELDFVGGLVYALSKDPSYQQYAHSVATEIADALKAVESLAVLLGESIQNHPKAAEIINAVEALMTLGGFASKARSGVNLMLPECNSHGAMDLGLLPDTAPGYQPLASDKIGRNTRGIFEGLIDGSIKCLYLMGCNPLTRFYDRELAEEALKSAEFVVVQDIMENELMQYADVVLPASSFAEKDGTFTNVEGRVQRIRAAIASPADARPDWDILAGLWLKRKMMLNQTAVPPFGPRQIMEEIIANVGQYKDCDYDKLGDNGVRWINAQTPT